MANPLKICVLGGGESGLGAAKLAQKLGHEVWLSDGGALASKWIEALNDLKISFEEGQHSMPRILASDLVIKSPGIPEGAAVIKAIREAGIEIISEIEWGYRHCTGKLIAITGTNGKTTVTTMVHHMLSKAGKEVALVGNVGHSFAGAIADGRHDYYALEVSSFQLDDIVHFKPHIAILTNISPDHLDRYNNSVDAYAAAKMRIFENQDANDHFIYCADDALSVKYLALYPIKAQSWSLSQESSVKQGAHINKGIIEIIINQQKDMDINELALQGKHNAYNSMASGVAGRLLNIRKETIRESLSSFDSIEHRLESVLQIYGIEFINDSKATNVNSTWYAMESMQKPTIWIAGGVDKGNDYSQLQKLAKQKVKALICLGVDNSKLHAAFEGDIPLVIDAADMDEAVRMAYKMGDKGDAVLLSPACASFDLFENYEDRGRQFKLAVRQL
ncbi:MAG: UDP-N-acetylmuramoyl-L-alanine--D-glutamate ligase [Croceimicrobium sp.]